MIKNRLKLLQGDLSVREFADRLSTSSSTLWQYLQGRTPPAEIIVRVCERYDVCAWWLLTGEGEKNNRKFREVTQLMELLYKNDLMLELVKRIAGLGDLEMGMLLGIADYLAALRGQQKDCKQCGEKLDLVLQRLGQAGEGATT